MAPLPPLATPVARLIFFYFKPGVILSLHMISSDFTTRLSCCLETEQFRSVTGNVPALGASSEANVSLSATCTIQRFLPKSHM